MSKVLHYQTILKCKHVCQNHPFCFSATTSSDSAFSYASNGNDCVLEFCLSYIKLISHFLHKNRVLMIRYWTKVYQCPVPELNLRIQHIVTTSQNNLRVYRTFQRDPECNAVAYVTPVSYSHLYVYKRQFYLRVMNLHKQITA